MVLESSPGGTYALEFEMKGGFQEVAAINNGTVNSAPVHWDANVPHLFKIVVVSPGKVAEFYIDGVLVKTLTSDVPSSGFLLEASEIKADTATASGVAWMDTYGGVFVGA